MSTESPIESGTSTWALIPHGVSVGPTRRVTQGYILIPSPPADQPNKRYLLDGPTLDMSYATFKKMEALNGLLALRMAEHKITEAEREEVRKQTMWAEAARRLPM